MTHKIMLAYIHPGFVRHEMMLSVLRTISDPRYVVSTVQVESGTNVQRARNDCVRHFLTNGGQETHLWFVDTDMSWEPDVPEALISRDVPIVSALYLGQGLGGVAFPVGATWDEERDGMTRYLRMDELNGLVPVAGVGMGCAMIRRDVLEMLASVEGQSHPDQWPFAQGQRVTPGGILSISEDITFCLRANELGYTSYIATDVPAGHVKSFVMTPPVQGAEAPLAKG